MSVNLSKADRERVKQASQSLLDSIRKLIAPLERWTEKEQTQAEVEVFILGHLFQALPTPPFSDEEKEAVAKRVYAATESPISRERFIVRPIRSPWFRRLNFNLSINTPPNPDTFPGTCTFTVSLGRWMSFGIWVQPPLNCA
jgi:hypothetical protein